MTSTAVVPSCSAEAIQAERDAVVAAAEVVAGYLRSCPSGFPRLWMDAHGGNRVEFDVEVVTRDADAAAWNRLLQETGLWSFMDKTARDDWREKIERPRYGTPPPLPAFTVAEAEAVALAIHADRRRMVARGVAEVHRRLSPDYRRNEVGRFGRRLVVKGLATVWGSSQKWLSVNHHVADALDDLDRFLHLVRGLPEPDHRTGGAYRKIGAATNSAPSDVEFPFWTVRLFKNGNGHLAFKFDEDVDRLNRILAVAGEGAIADDVRSRQW